MEVTKRTYQKHKTEKKITIKHYLLPKNTMSIHDTFNEKGKSIGKFEIYHIVSPIYVQVTYNRKSTKFRSEIRECYLDNIPDIPIFENFNEFEEYYFNENNDLVRGLTRDCNYIKWMVEQEIRINPNFDISALPEIYHSSKYHLINFVEYCLNGDIQLELMSKLNCIVEDEQKNSKYQNIFVDFRVSALQNLEYFINLYSELEFSNIKDKYSPQIWFLNLYLGDVKMGYVLDMEIQGNEEYRYYVNLPTSITIFDYLTNLVKRKFFPNNHDITTEIQERICNDIDKFFAENFALYDFMSLLDNHNSFFKFPLNVKDYTDHTNH